MRSPNLEQTLRNMMEAARVAARFYGMLAESTRDVEAEAFLEGLVARENAHAEAIEMLALETTDRALPPYADRFVNNANITPDWGFVEGITYHQAIDVALDAASHAALLYGALADGSPEPARRLLLELESQLEAQVNQLIALQKRPGGKTWSFRNVARSDVRQGIRNGIAAELAAARFHTELGASAKDRAARIFLQQLALEEEANAEQLEILVLDRSDWTLPVDPEPHAATIKLFAPLDFSDDVSLATALEHALYAQTRGARYYRVLASLASPDVAPGLELFAREQDEHLTQLIARRNTYWTTNADDVPSMTAEQLARLRLPR
jgi:rubrerythrin